MFGFLILDGVKRERERETERERDRRKEAGDDWRQNVC